MKKLKFALLGVVAATALAVSPVSMAKPFKWASAGEISTWDIHSQNNALQNGIHAAVYESLVYYNSRTFKIEPVLATAWNQVSPTQLRITLRMRLYTPDGVDLIPETELQQQRDISYNESQALAKENEEALLFNDMQAELVQQLMRRLAVVKVR